MDHAAGVGVSHRLAHRLEDRQEPGRVGLGPAVGEERRQGLALHQLHGEEWPVVCQRAQIIHRHDSGVLKLAADLGLLDEAVDQVGAVAMLIEQDLEGEVAAQVRVAAPQHQAHPAAGDFAQELIATGPGVGAARPFAAVLVRLVQHDTRDDRPHPGADTPQDDAAVFTLRRDIEVEGPIATGVDASAKRGQTGKALVEIAVLESGQLARRQDTRREGGQASSRAAAMLLHVQPDHRVDHATLVGIQGA